MSETAAHKCHGKRRHRSERQAAAIAKNWQITTGCEMQAYECEFCKGWHVGNLYPANSREARSTGFRAQGLGIRDGGLDG